MEAIFTKVGDCLFRLKEGGLGVIFLSKLNKSLLCKFNWHFANERGALWKQVINGKYEEEEGGRDWALVK